MRKGWSGGGSGWGGGRRMKRGIRPWRHKTERLIINIKISATLWKRWRKENTAVQYKHEIVEITYSVSEIRGWSDPISRTGGIVGRSVSHIGHQLAICGQIDPTLTEIVQVPSWQIRQLLDDVRRRRRSRRRWRRRKRRWMRGQFGASELEGETEIEV